jgi:uncharacterized protein with PIN domain|tara:strand:+ start:312 stop:530 length:219 start_codon:yes stop_codon:yes gene_type:complete
MALEIKLFDNKKSKCDMCKKDIIRKNKYEIKTAISSFMLIVCEICALKEYYGTKYKQSKRYKKAKDAKKFFK